MSEQIDSEKMVRDSAAHVAKLHNKPVVIYAANGGQTWHSISAQWHAEYVTPDGAWHPLGEQAAAYRPRRICLCGSTRFKRAYQEWNARLTLDGNVVLSVAMWSQSKRVDPTAEQKELLDRVHLAKIDAADEVFVLDVGGYIGDSTRREIAHAEATGKPVRYLSKECPEWTENDCQYVQDEQPCPECEKTGRVIGISDSKELPEAVGKLCTDLHNARETTSSVIQTIESACAGTSARNAYELRQLVEQLSQQLATTRTVACPECSRLSALLDRWTAGPAVTLVVNDERYDCKVIDVGHADPGLVVECHSLPQTVQAPAYVLPELTEYERKQAAVPNLGKPFVVWSDDDTTARAWVDSDMRIYRLIPEGSLPVAAQVLEPKRTVLTPEDLESLSELAAKMESINWWGSETLIRKIIGSATCPPVAAAPPCPECERLRDALARSLSQPPRMLVNAARAVVETQVVSKGNVLDLEAALRAYDTAPVPDTIDLQGAAHEQYVYGGQDPKTPSILSDADADFLAGLVGEQHTEFDNQRLRKMVADALAAAEARAKAPAPSPAPGLVAAAEALIEAVKRAIRGQPGGSLFHSCMVAESALAAHHASQQGAEPTIPTPPGAHVTRDGEHVTIIGKGFQFDGTVDNALGNFAAMTHMYCERGERRPAPASSGQVVELFVARSEGDKSDVWLWFNKPAEMLDGCWISSGKLPGASHLPDKYRDLIPPGTCVPCKLVIGGGGDGGKPEPVSESAGDADSLKQRVAELRDLMFKRAHERDEANIELGRARESTDKALAGTTFTTLAELRTAYFDLNANLSSLQQSIIAACAGVNAVNAYELRTLLNAARAECNRLTLKVKRLEDEAERERTSGDEVEPTADTPTDRQLLERIDQRIGELIGERNDAITAALSGTGYATLAELRAAHDEARTALANARESVDRQAALVHEVEGQRKALSDCISAALHGTNLHSLPALREQYDINVRRLNNAHSVHANMEHVIDSFCADHGCKTLAEVSAKLADTTAALTKLETEIADAGRGVGCHNAEMLRKELDLSKTRHESISKVIASALKGTPFTLLSNLRTAYDTAIAKLAADPLASAGELGEWVKCGLFWDCVFRDRREDPCYVRIFHDNDLGLRLTAGEYAALSPHHILALSAAVLRHRATGDPRKEAGK